MSRSFVQRVVTACLALLGVLLLPGCASLPPPPERVVSQALTEAEVASTALARAARRPADVPAQRKLKPSRSRST